MTTVAATITISDRVRRLWAKTRSLRRFAVVGGISRALQTLMLWGFTDRLGVHYIVSSLIAVAVVFGLGYILNRWWAFARE
jgi:putative flippase GtrA